MGASIEVRLWWTPGSAPWLEPPRLVQTAGLSNSLRFLQRLCRTRPQPSGPRQHTFDKTGHVLVVLLKFHEQGVFPNAEFRCDGPVNHVRKQGLRRPPHVEGLARRLTQKELVRDDADGPNIHLLRAALFFPPHFRSGVGWTCGQARDVGGQVLEVRWVASVGQVCEFRHNSPAASARITEYEYVLRPDAAMQPAPALERLHRLQKVDDHQKLHIVEHVPPSLGVQHLAQADATALHLDVVRRRHPGHGRTALRDAVGGNAHELHDVAAGECLHSCYLAIYIRVLLAIPCHDLLHQRARLRLIDRGLAAAALRVGIVHPTPRLLPRRLRRPRPPELRTLEGALAPSCWSHGHRARPLPWLLLRPHSATIAAAAAAARRLRLALPPLVSAVAAAMAGWTLPLPWLSPVVAAAASWKLPLPKLAAAITAGIVGAARRNVPFPSLSSAAIPIRAAPLPWLFSAAISGGTARWKVSLPRLPPVTIIGGPLQTIIPAVEPTIRWQTLAAVSGGAGRPERGGHGRERRAPSWSDG
mmetsp:Transcript_67609/g.195442  ORF Transcript_67609/g.195442 Transcript_67609/m.195442 type:complete len:529 (+) Transcript_67609:107-1693(+)